MKKNLIYFFTVYCILCPASCFCIDSARVLWDDANKELDLNVAIHKFTEIVEKYPESSFAIDAQYLIAEYKYLEGDYAQAYQEFQILINKFPRNKYLSLSWYRKGSCLFATGQYDKAIKEFQQSISIDPRGEYGILARIGIADAYFAKNEYRKALEEYKSISPAYSVAFQPYILYKISLCAQSLDNEKEFKLSKEELIKKYPLSLESNLIGNIVKLNVQTSNLVNKTTEVLTGLNWTIQVGSFTKEENARSLSNGLIKKGYISWIEPVRLGEGIFYRVYLGKFKTEDEARKKSEEIALKENLPVRIVQLK